jgi:outer membrane receptor protein involved in Fe transport
LETQLKANRLFTLHAVAAASMLAMLPLQSAMAQAKETTLNLDEVVVTASPTARSKLKATDSVSTIGEEAIVRSGATNTADILRTVPGLRSESSGGEGNANIAVRGIPVAAGGARYIQLQEDGLPVLLFGDIAFGTSDQFMRTDFGTQNVEVVRGGGSSTSASNAPGAVINFISKTGKQDGDAVGVSTGTGSLMRTDFFLGRSLSSDTHLNFSGFARQGKGGAHTTDYVSEKGLQLRANVTKELSKGDYIRFNAKLLNDQVPMTMRAPGRLSGAGVTSNSSIDPLTYNPIKGSLLDTTLDKDGKLVTNDATDGLKVKTTSLGFEGKFNVSGWNLENRFRTSQTTGRFMAMHTAVDAGVFYGVLFNTSLDDMSNLFNDLKISQTFNLGEGAKLTPTFGLFYGKQNVAQTWSFNAYNYDANGQATSLKNTSFNQWGGCCSRTYEVSYTNKDPYASFNYENGPLNLDVGVRQQNQVANGSYAKAASNTTWGARSAVAYDISRVSSTLGASYSLNKDLVAYSRFSDGYNFLADRLLYDFKTVGGSNDINANNVKQLEVGLRGRADALTFSTTYFQAATGETNFDATTQKATQNRYRADGVELEMGYRAGGFRLASGMTLTNAALTGTADGSNVGNRPQRQADMVYAFSPSYSTGSLTFGGSLVGTSMSYANDANTEVMPGYNVVNAFTSYQFGKNLTASANVNNIFNTLAVTESEGATLRTLPGRTIRVSARYDF